MSALAIICKRMGWLVSGSDSNESLGTKRLAACGIKIFIGHNQNNVIGASVVVYSSAIKPSNPEFQYAKNHGILLISRAQLLGVIAKNYDKVVGISGSHGKTTVTGMIAIIFLHAQKNPTIHIGGNLPDINGNVFVGDKKYFVTEACEYCDSFLSLNCYYSVVLNIQKDHMDYFKKMSNLQNSFKKFAKNTNKNGFLIINNDDKNCQNLKCNSQKITYGIENNSLLMAKNIHKRRGAKYSFDLFVCNQKITRICLSVCGYHNIYNALASIGVALLENIDIFSIKRALKNYRLPERRYELVKKKHATIIHDYAHHPTEIAAAIKTAKSMCKGKLIVAFQPHTFSRTQYLFDEFSKCFCGVDKLFICPIYAAREKPIAGITSENLAKAVAKNGVDVQAVADLDDCKHCLDAFDKKGNYILLLGAGSIVNLCSKF